MAKTISQLTPADAADATNLFEISEGSGDPVVYSSKKLTLNQLAQAVANVLNYSGLDTTSKTLVGAINEVESTKGTNVVANPSDSSTDTLSTVKIGNVVYDLAGGGGGGDTPVTGTLTLASDWTPDDSYGGAYYKKVGNVVYVHIWASYAGYTDSAPVCNLPQEILPSHAMCVWTHTNNGTASSYVWIESWGELDLISSNNQTFDIQLDFCYII